MVTHYYDPIDVENSTCDSRSLVLPYQKDAIDSLTNYYHLDEDEPARHGVLVMPTGSGKTFTTVSWLMNEAIPRGYKVLWLVHRRELVDQAYHEFCNCSPMLKQYGIKKIHITPYSSAHASLNTCIGGEISVCCIQSLSNVYGFRKIKMLLKNNQKNRLIVVVDEAHHGISDSYRKVLIKVGELYPNYILLGLTATPFRVSDMEQNKLNVLYDIPYNLYERKYNKYNGYIYEVTLKQLLSQKGTLANPIYIPVDTQLKACDEYELSEEVYDYYQRYQELSSEALSEIASCERRNLFIVDYYLKHKNDFGKTLIFALNQDHARELCKLLSDKGVPSKCAISDNPDSQLVIREFKDNKFPVLVNVQMLTEGSDVPDIQTVFLTRETNSSTLLMQMIGRGLRGTNANGTETCNIVAFHDVWDRFINFMDPGTLPLFPSSQTDENGVEEEDCEDAQIVPACYDQDVMEVEEEAVEEDKRVSFDLEYLIRELSAQVKQAVERGIYTSPISPIGWYHVELANSQRVVLVYDSQKSSYDELSREGDVMCIIKSHLDGAYVRRAYFSMLEQKPTVEDLDAIAQYMKVVFKMPPYYSFEQRDDIDIKSIANKLNDLNSDYEKDKFLVEVYRSNDLLKAIYGNQSNFVETVKNSLKSRFDSEILYSQDSSKRNYRYVPGTHNLSDLYNELINSPLCEGLLSRPLNLRLYWSDHFVRNWCAICEWDGLNVASTRYEIRVNKIYDSPDVDKEVIKYLIFHELLHAYGYRSHDLTFRKHEWKYPNSSELDHFLDTLWMRYDISDVKGTWIGFESHAKDMIGVYGNHTLSEDDKIVSCNQEIISQPAGLEKVAILSQEVQYLNSRLKQQGGEITEMKKMMQEVLALLKKKMFD